MVRVPLLPVETYDSLRTAEDQCALLKDPRVRRAVAVGSVSMLNALDRFEQATLSRKDTVRLVASLLRYEIRMSTRPTPFGLFAGCAIARFGDRTDLNIVRTFGRAHTRPDMGWLIDLVMAAESDPAIRRKLRLIRNPLARFEGDRVFMSVGTKPVSVRATRVVKQALNLARMGIQYEVLAASLQHESASASPEKVERLISQLCDQAFLATDLRPPLTTESPARYVLEKLAYIPEAVVFHDRLSKLLSACAVWDQCPDEDSLAAFRSLLNQMDLPEDGSKEAPVQVDLALCVEGRLGVAIASEAARAAELLLRLSPSPRGPGSIAAYRGAFISRYGHEREVPLLELLDPDRGLGPVSLHGHVFTGPDPATAATRSETLLAIACSALHNRSRIVSLQESDIARLETWRPTATTAPVSLDINILVAARSAEAIDRGEYMVIPGPNLGAWAAGRNFGRFAHLDPVELGKRSLNEAASIEQSLHFTDHIWAEVVYLPPKARSANVSIRPAIRSHEVVFGVSPGVPQSASIPLDELLVGVADGRFYIYWPAARKRVRFVSGHMLSYYNAPPVAQFLIEAAFDGTAVFSSFDWGPAEGFPFLPRVQVGRVALRPAEWKLAKETIPTNDHAGFNKWRREWDVPRYVCLVYADNRLVLDLDLGCHVDQILSEMAKLASGQRLSIQEVFPALEEAWLTGKEGHYYSEFIVPLVLRPAPDTPASEKGVLRLPSKQSAETRTASPAADVRRRPPGSEWLYLKLYCPKYREDDLIGDYLLAFAGNAIAAELADSWFFLRYADPDGHIRVRFHGLPDRLSTHLFGHACRWADNMMGQGICTRMAIETYDREIERFGGVEGTALSERLFHEDSNAVARLVGILKSDQWKDADARTALFALTIDDLLGSLGLTDEQREAWYKERASDTRHGGSEYRRLKTGLRTAVGDVRKWLAGMPSGAGIEECLNRRKRALSGIGKEFGELSDARLLTQPLASLCISYVHLHLNRLGATGEEAMLLELLSRVRSGLMRAPVRQVVK